MNQVSQIIIPSASAADIAALAWGFLPNFSDEQTDATIASMAAAAVSTACGEIVADCGATIMATEVSLATLEVINMIWAVLDQKYQDYIDEIDPAMDYAEAE